MKFKRMPMVDWYDTRQLAATGLKTVISSIFGNFADKREIQAALSNNEPFDYSHKEELWIDYISDLGDGFNSTYTMAHLLAQKELQVDQHRISRGDILIMGGDEVYPTPETEEYKNRLRGPYESALPENKDDPDPPHLFAIPGNHDWYDGLSNFIKLFCQGRTIGNWRTQQKRSYFALKLPYNHWLWGVDIQLQADIDKPQLDYFARVSQSMEPGDKIILCTAEPAWVFDSIHRTDKSYKKFKWFLKEYIHEKGFDPHVILTGDFHHYSHYAVESKEGAAQHLITAGGGGAFMHPTHMLKDRLKDKDFAETRLCAAYPSREKSRQLAFLNLAFPIYNWGLALFMGCFYLILAWLLFSGNPGLYGNIGRHPFSFSEVAGALSLFGSAVVSTPVVLLLNLALLAALFMFTDTECGKGKTNYLAGGFHAVAQLAVFYLLTWLFCWLNVTVFQLEGAVWTVVVFSAEMILLGSLVGGFVFGIYLLISALLFNSHPTEAYSSIKGEDYKNFLRLHLTEEKLTIYPIGVDKSVKNWKNTGTEEMPVFKGDDIEYKLIEDPIQIKIKNYEKIIKPDHRFEARI